MKRLMKKQAKRAAKNAGAAAASGAAVSDAYRDGKGNYWRDRDEEMEYAPLVPPADDAGERDWANDTPTAEIAGFADSFVPEPPQLAAPAIKKRKSRKDVRSLFIGTD